MAAPLKKRKLPAWLAKQDEVPKHLVDLLATLDLVLPAKPVASPLPPPDVPLDNEGIIAKFAKGSFEMRDHQEAGVSFMVDVLLGRKEHLDLFVFLGDEMGLGKTVQILATCLAIHTLQKTYATPLNRGVFVIVVPRVIIPNFISNGGDFLGIPKARFISYTGAARHRRLRQAMALISHAADAAYPTFIVCNPEIVRSDGIHSPLFALPITLLIMDEAHKIKNHDTQTNRLMRRFRCMTTSLGTNALPKGGIRESSLATTGSKGAKGFLFSTATFVCNGMNDLLGYVAVYGGTVKLQMVKQWLRNASHRTIQEYFGKHMVRRTVSVLRDALPERKELLVPVIPTQIESSLIDLLSDAATNVWSANEEVKKSDVDREEKSRMAAMVLVNILRLRQGCIAGDLVSGQDLAEKARVASKRDSTSVVSLCATEPKVETGAKEVKAIYLCCIRCFGQGSSINPLTSLACGHKMCTKCHGSLASHFRKFSPLALSPGSCGACGLLAHYHRRCGPPGTSTKFFYALRILETMLRSDPDQKAGVLIFSEFKKSLDLFQIICTKAGIRSFILHGGLTSTAKDELVKTFQDEDTPVRVMMLTMGTGGVGLNLQRANKMIILDPTWDPKKEEQAIGRIYRIGQTRDVRVVRLAYVNAVEDAIRALQAKKHEEARVVNYSVRYGGSTTKDTVELDFYDGSLARSDPVEKFMCALKDIVTENYEKRCDGERVKELAGMQADLEVKMGVPPGWLTPDWSFLAH
jgi:SNF2 family DNA or RNA helicase